MTDPHDLPDEMHTPTPDHDEYQPGTEPGLDALFADLSSAAHAGNPVAPNAALHEFVSIGRVDISDSATGGVVHDLGDVPMGASTSPETPRRKPVLSTFTALIASATGKLVLTGGIAAASVAGAHSTGVVDVPLLPDVSEAAVVIVQDDESAEADPALQADPSPSTTAAPAAAQDDDSSSDDDVDTDPIDVPDEADDVGDELDGTVTLTINGEEVQLTDDEIDAFLSDFETNIEENSEAWEAAAATCEAAFDALDTDEPSADIDAFLAEIDAAMQTCFDALDAADLMGPLSGLDLSEIEDLDFDLDLEGLDDLEDFTFDLDDLEGFDPDDFGFDLDDLDIDDFDFDEFGDLDDLDDFDPEAFGDFDLEDFPFGELPFDPTDPDSLDGWLEDQGIDLDNLNDLDDFDDFDGLDGLDDFDGFEGFDGLDGFDEFFDDLDEFDGFFDELEDHFDGLDGELDDLEDDIDS